MIDEEERVHLSTERIAQLCRENTDQYKQKKSSDPRFCAELIRRAIIGKDEAAWAYCYDTYSPEFASRLRHRHGINEANIEDFVQMCWRRIHRQMTPEKVVNRPFKSLRSYMNRCVDGEIGDIHRKMNRRISAESLDAYATPYELLEAALRAEREAGKSVEAAAAFHMRVDEIWQLIETICAQDTDGETLKAAAEAAFIYGLKPRQVVERYAEFEDDEAFRNAHRRLIRLVKKALTTARKERGERSSRERTS